MFIWIIQKLSGGGSYRHKQSTLRFVFKAPSPRSKRLRNDRTPLRGFQLQVFVSARSCRLNHVRLDHPKLSGGGSYRHKQSTLRFVFKGTLAAAARKVLKRPEHPFVAVHSQVFLSARSCRSNHIQLDQLKLSGGGPG